MARAPTYKDVKALNPCIPAFHGNKIDAAAARAAGCSLSDIVWVASAVARTDPDVERRLRLWMADFAARVLHIYERSESSGAPREAIVAARRFARGEIDDAALAAARDAAWSAEMAVAWSSARDAAWSAAMAAAWSSARNAAWSAAMEAAWAATGSAEEAWQFDRLIARLSDVEPADVPLPPRSSAQQED